MGKFWAGLFGVVLAAVGGWIGQSSGGPVWAAVGGVIGLLAGLVIGFYRTVGRWGRAMIEAAKLLVRQQQEPGKFIVPYVSSVELFPGRTKSAEEQNYITVELGWDNRTFMRVTIESIGGEHRRQPEHRRLESGV